MKTNKRANGLNGIIIFLALIVLSCFAVFLASCTGGGDPAATDSGTAPATEAPDEGPAVITGWFDYGSALYRRDKFTPGTAGSIAIDIAKNEIEGFQYLLTSDKDVSGLRCDVTDLDDGAGNKLTGTVNVVWYTYVRKADATHPRGFYPVAMLPMDDEYQGGEFDIAAGTCRTLYVRYKTTADTVPGTYTGKLTVSMGGESVLTGDVTVRVRDVYYDEKTECLTMVGLGYDKEDMNEAVPKGPDGAPPLGRQQQGGAWDRGLLLDYAYFMLENRLCPSWVPFENELLNEDFEKVKAFMDNPRVTSTGISGPPWPYTEQERVQSFKGQSEIAHENGWVDKIYFGSFDEPHEEAHMKRIIGNAGWVRKYFGETTNFLDAFYVDLPSDGKNIVERMSAYSTVYCPKVEFFNGAIRDSLLRLKAERGDTIFWYNCGVASYDTVNMLPCTPGTDKRVLFWQQYQQNVDGYLYWRATYWNGSEDPWETGYVDKYVESPPYPRPNDAVTDDGVLIYWHPVTKQPVTTLGLEATRDGVEDFQLLRMCEAKFGREKVLEFVEQIATDYNAFTQYRDGSTGLMNGLRAQLFDLLESAA